MSNQDTQAIASVSWAGGMSGVVAPQALDDNWSPARDAQATDFTTAIDCTLLGLETGKHPTMRGWLAVPLVGEDGRNYGLLQLSDKYDEADFTQEDETQLEQLARLTATTLGALLRLHENQFPGQQEVQ